MSLEKSGSRRAATCPVLPTLLLPAPRKVRRGRRGDEKIDERLALGAYCSPMPSRRHGFKTLSEAILAGCGKQPSIESGGALRAAWSATFTEAGDLGPFHSANLRDIYPELKISTGDSCPRGPATSCPEWPKRSARTLEAAIYHLEGVHQLKPEDVARWLVAHGY